VPPILIDGVMVRSRVEDPRKDMLVAMDNSSVAWYGSRLLHSLSTVTACSTAVDLWM
jgi:hypothetical protein